MSVAGLIAIFFLKESAGKPLEGSEPNVETEWEAHLIHTARLAAVGDGDIARTAQITETRA